MTQWTPTWRVKVDGTEVTGVALANLTITSGRTDIYSQPQAGYCQVQLKNTDETIYDFNVGTSISIEVQNSTSTFIPIFGGYISDYSIAVDSAGNVDFTTLLSITAVGALSKLNKIIDTTALSQDYDGDQIYTLLANYLLGQWSEVPAAQTWTAYDPTETWTNAVNIGLGQIDQPGIYEMISTNATPTILYNKVAQIATSGFGYIYEDANGNIGYADTEHRQDYLTANGYVDLSANNAEGRGIAIATRSGDIRNKLTVAYDNNGSKSYSYTNDQSQALYGTQEQSATSSIKHTADAEALTQRYIGLRAFPYPQFQALTYRLANPELTNTQRDALLGIFMGMPVNIQNLPQNMLDGSYQGFVEGWTFRASFNGLDLTFNASPTSFNLSANKWQSVIATEQWNTISTTMDWLNATIVA